jgi:hypothetical protein
MINIFHFIAWIGMVKGHQKAQLILDWLNEWLGREAVEAELKKWEESLG